MLRSQAIRGGRGSNNRCCVCLLLLLRPWVPEDASRENLPTCAGTSWLHVNLLPMRLATFGALLFCLWSVHAVAATKGNNVGACCLNGRKVYASRKECLFAGSSDIACARITTVCCLTALYETKCDEGKSVALTEESCEGLDAPGREHAKECCHCCLLGREALKRDERCTPPSHLGRRCKQAFISCCGDVGDLGGSDDNHLRSFSATTTTDSNYEYSANGRCSENQNLCEQICDDSNPAAVRCSCRNGFRLNPDGRTCTDIDECQEDVSPCDPTTQLCENTPGSYRCDCLNGFSWNATVGLCLDIDECLLYRDDCIVGQRCINTIGSWRCIRTLSCGTGYYLDSETDTCLDIDECGLGTHNCGPGYTCRNTHGSFRCERRLCPTGQQWDSEQRSCVASVTCSPGFHLTSDGTCQDMNECHLPDACPPGQRCQNTQGSYYCEDLDNPCPSGYERSNAGDRCVDIDECSRGMHSCPEPDLCENTPGGYHCRCPVGYRYNPSTKQCEDVDECQSPHACLHHSSCENTIGSFRCVCQPGYQLAEHGRSCVDIDECRRSMANCHQRCINTPGSYQCACDRGYTLGVDGTTCLDIDECALYKFQGSGLCAGQCINTPGSFECRCPHGFQLGRDGRTCEDVDECTNGMCSGNDEICINMYGSYKCQQIVCPPNYVKDVRFKNRCNRSSQTCSPFDHQCIHAPVSLLYNFISLPSDVNFQDFGLSALPLITLKGPTNGDTSVQYELQLLETRLGRHGIRPASRASFAVQKMSGPNSAVLNLVEPLQGPQDVLLDLIMHFHHAGNFGGRSTAKIFIFVSEFKETDFKGALVREGYACRKSCYPLDISCLANMTASISYQFISLPSVEFIKSPLEIGRVYPESRTPRPYFVKYEIDYPSRSYFALEQRDNVGVLFMHTPLPKGSEYVIFLNMDTYSASHVQFAANIAFVTIFN
uniref:Fibulin-1 n=1 Tax=Trichuris muris TaxID=70415 RepID=A0A5S6R2B7_TRIMR